MYRRFIKRALDIIFSLLLLIILSPILLVVCICLIFANEGAGVFFHQVRPGFKGQPFPLLKFKTMNEKRDASGKLLPDLQRITKVGRILRKTSIDELPQLWNVLMGDMSFIGPRPLLKEYLPLYSAEQARRHDVLPGITGWAQCHGRNTQSWKERFKLDVWYVDNLSFAVDVKVVLLTIQTILSLRGVDSETTNSKFTIEPFNGNN